MGPLTAGLVFLSLPLGIKLARITPDTQPDAFGKLDGKTAQLHMAFGILLVVGMMIGG